MQDKKPLKRNESIIRLSKDHHFTLLFCWKIRTGLKFGAQPVRIISYVRYFWQHHMRPHFEEEETILFEQVKDVSVQKALDEHAQIAEQIQALITTEDEAASRLSILADTIDNHVRYEERELFPHLENVLTVEQLKTIGSQLTAAHQQELKDDFADEFWLKHKNVL